MEASAFGLRWIVEMLRERGVPVERFVATGGLPHHNPLLVQIYADVLGAPIAVHPSKHGPALGAAILGVLAAGDDASGFRKRPPTRFTRWRLLAANQGAKRIWSHPMREHASLMTPCMLATASCPTRSADGGLRTCDRAAALRASRSRAPSALPRFHCKSGTSGRFCACRCRVAFMNSTSASL